MTKTGAKHFEYIVIGGGSGGVASSRRAGSYGVKTLLIEGNHVGGTCVNVGCVPKKVMWYASSVAQRISEAKDYGFDVDPKLAKTFNWGYFTHKRDAYIEKLNGIYERNLKNDNVELLYGWAKFNKDGAVVVTKKDGSCETFTGDKILIATGGKPIAPTIPGSEYIIDSNGFFSLKEQPKRVAIVGGGYIGVEFTGLLHGLGSETHLILRDDQILVRFDDSIRDTVLGHYADTGVNIHYETEVKSVEKMESGALKLTLSTGSMLEVDALIWTVGRRTFLGLGLENVGVQVTDRGLVKVDEYQNTTTANIYALGDVTGQLDLTPVAISAGRKLANRLFGPAKFKAQKQNYTNVPSALFSHPEAGSVGLSEVDAIEKYGKDNLKIYRSRFTPMYYAMVEQKSPVSYKIICAGPEEKVVGLHLVGDYSSEILQGFSVAIMMGATKADFDSVVAIHPSSAEELVTMT